MNINFEHGGAAVLDRIIKAYGFKSKIELCNYLDITASTLSMRYKRDIFPHDIVIRCILDTQVSLLWLATGEGTMYKFGENNIQTLDKFLIRDGSIFPDGQLIFDKSFLPKELIEPQVIVENNISYIIDKKFNDVFDGKWLVEIEGKTSIKNLARIPIKKIRICNSNNKILFECKIDDIKIIARVAMVCHI